MERAQSLEFLFINWLSLLESGLWHFPVQFMPTRRLGEGVRLQQPIRCVRNCLMVCHNSGWNKQPVTRVL